VVFATSVITGIKTAGELADSIQKMINLIPKAADDLTEKHRWMTITTFNQTQFSLVYQRTWFKSGRFWTSPTNIAPFESMTFSVCSRDGSLLTGVTGGAAFELQMPQAGGGYQRLDIAVGFARPEIGSVKCSAIFSDDPERAYERVNSNFTRRVSNVFPGTNIYGGQVAMNFLAVASPGQEASVTITQQILKEVIP
jgi:hypothetical protein